MKRSPTVASLFVIVLFLSAVVLALPRFKAQAQESPPQAVTLTMGTAFTYQGQLLKNGAPLTDTCDLRFQLYDALAGGSQVGSTQTLTGVGIGSGLFTVQVDFGQGAFDGAGRWLEIATKCTGDPSFVTLSPRQALTPSPYALALPGLYTQENATSPNLIGGYSGNSVTAGVVGATIAGGGNSGELNLVTDNYGAIGGGGQNQAGDAAGALTDAAYATVGGGRGNLAGEFASTIGGGEGNQAAADFTTVGGGYGNGATNYASTIAGGGQNQASGNYTTVGGGIGNLVGGDYAIVGGGAVNVAAGDYATVGGGNSNDASGNYATIGGGSDNEATGLSSAIGGGQNNQAVGSNATVGGGSNNEATGLYSAIGGGQDNQTTGNYTTVGGGWNNLAANTHAAVCGGANNQGTGERSIIAGGANNQATSYGSTIAGGGSNQASGVYATIPGGYGAVASHYGEMAYASGAFAFAGDAQASRYVLRGVSTSASSFELFLDGVDDRLTIPNTNVWAFDILVVGRTPSGNAGAGYRITGVIENAGGAVAFIGAPVVTVLGEDLAGWNVSVTADITNDALTIFASGSAGLTIRWVAVVNTAQVQF
ncbi:MAG: hypothetical protein L0332_22980 [Chloroflexi bacterium]|nr:hypothetical protein [Chloroflexota bacterium]MCI0578217.1 hypothetical protein [Chloroflexota bacterium]MCI0645290.1 hypothetical protein [Chloroflexota bacterium]MCI0729556.1 hypothetical protein [Chloroflexota bacterium]